jgi:hypothetical protein
MPQVNAAALARMDVFGGKELQAEAFSDSEKIRYETAWDYMVRTKNRMVDPEIWDERHKVTTSALAQVFKREKGGAIYEGMAARNGYGMQLPRVRDLLGAPTEIWDVTWATTGFRNWISTTAPDTSTFGASVPVQLIDAAQDFWDVILYGLIDFDASPKSKEVEIEINSEVYPIVNVEYGQRSSEMAASYFDAAYWIQRASRIRVGIHVETLGASVPFPIGVVFESNIRSKQEFKNRAT